MSSGLRDSSAPAGWMEPDYYVRRRDLSRLQKRLVPAAFILGVLGLGALALMPDSQTVYQPHAVAPSHASFNNNCAKCHDQNFQTAKRLIHWDASIRSVSDHACSQCHDGPPHNASLIEHVHCATCHREHQGRSALTQVPDAQCAKCHSSLKSHHRSPQTCRFQDVTGFPDGHPELSIWRSPAMDSAGLRFSHQAHLQLHSNSPALKMKISCRDCHQLDAAGQYLMPINYEKHCAACHPLSLRLSGSFPDVRVQQAVERFNRTPAPHLSPSLVRGALRERLHQLTREAPLLPQLRDDPKRIPVPRRAPWAGDVEWTPANRPLRADERAQFANRQLSVLERELFVHSGGCRFCHVQSDERAAPKQIESLPEYLATNLRSRWFAHSRFNHKSHRAVECGQCHSAHDSKKTSDVLMPRMQTCAQCHNREAGAPSSCVTCHDYHPR